MALPGFTESPMFPLRGMWSDMDHVQPDLLRGRAFVAQNVRVLPGRVKTRPGHTATSYTVTAACTALFHFQNKVDTLDVNYIYYYADGKVRNRDLVTPGSEVEVRAQSGYAATFAQAGDKLYFTVYDSSMNGQGGLFIGSPLTASSPSDKAFGPPMTAVPVMSELGGSGQVTEGEHLFGYVVVYRSGNYSIPSPAAGSASTEHAPVSFTVGAGGKQLTMSITADTPSDIEGYHAVMTRVDNPDRWYYVPGGFTQVPPSTTGWTQLLGINVSDESLAASADEVPSYQFTKTSQLPDGTVPLSPAACMMYGQRLVLLAAGKAYVSDQNDFEAITEQRHTVQMRGQRSVYAAAPLNDSIYWFGSNWTAQSWDNGEEPRQWPAPDDISNSIGVVSPYCVEYQTNGDLIWVCHRSGVYAFTGQYAMLPVTYMLRTRWATINWAAGHTIRMLDNPTTQTLRVAVPTGVATQPNEVWVIDYSRGRSALEVDITIDTFASFVPCSMALVEESNKSQAVWLGPGASGAIVKEDAAATSDNGAIITSIYETGNVMEGFISNVMQFEQLNADVRGAGTLHARFNCKDRTVYKDLLDVTLAASPGRITQRAVDLIGANGNVKFMTDALNEWLDLRAVSVDYRPYSLDWA